MRRSLIHRLGMMVSAAAAVATACILTAAPARAQPDAPPDPGVEASFLYKLEAFVGWPPGAFASQASPFNLCVQGTDPFGPALDRAVAGQRVGPHPIVVRRMEFVGADTACHTIYIGGSKRQSAVEVLRVLKGSNVLTVTDGDRPLGARGIIHFVNNEGRLRFIIDAGAADDNGLIISAKLLDLALAVRLRK
jgi:hypothetical protein